MIFCCRKPYTSDPMEITVLGSSSKGNSILISSRSDRILVDAGLSYSYIRGALSRLGVEAEELSGLLLTHEHGDHTAGVLRFVKNHPGVPVYSTRPTLWSLRLERGVNPVTPGRVFTVGEFTVRPFPVPHDALQPVGYRIESGGRVAAVALDTGSVNRALIEALRGSHSLVVEANHNRRMLREGPYPFPLKRRIADPLGHLSNDQCGRLLKRVVDPGTRTVVLAHLSEKNNTPSLALSEVVEHLVGDGGGTAKPPPLGGGITIEVAKPREIVGPFKV
ncbi:MAG: MBL fold metallo-hydrolase [Thermoplasmata archaeon]|nr:MAG: MBL fold metallo-hydrolase [Thermoplasmata archaeon]